MNISTRTIAGATATLALLLVATACGSETVSDTDPGTAPAANRIYPPTSIPPVPVEIKKRSGVRRLRGAVSRGGEGSSGRRLDLSAGPAAATTRTAWSLPAYRPRP